MAKIKLVASDLDGTLLTSNKGLTPRLKAAIEKITDMGIVFIPATGRVYDAVPEEIKALPSKYIITSNGARIYDVENKRDIYECLLCADDARYILEIAKGLHVIFEIFSDGKAFIDQKAFDRLESYNLTVHHKEYIRKTRIPIDIDRLLVSNSDSLENINIIFSDLNDRSLVLEKLKNTNHFSVTASSEINIEITNINATKGNAVKKLCELLSIDLSNTLAFGDSENDLDMILSAAVGVAMGNSPENIKQKADIIAESCDSFGEAIILERLAEKGEL